jgi:hypothetical protein
MLILIRKSDDYYIIIYCVSRYADNAVMMIDDRLEKAVLEVTLPSPVLAVRCVSSGCGNQGSGHCSGSGSVGSACF